MPACTCGEWRRGGERFWVPLGMVLLLFAPPALALDSCPVPPVLSSGSAAPNVLLIMDHSGSMGGGPGSRWETAKRVLLDLLDAYPGVRFGLMRMDGSDYEGNDRIGEGEKVRQGGKILRPCGTPKEELKAYLEGWGGAENRSNQPQSWTNLAETLASAGRYFATGTDGKGKRVSLGPDGLGHYAKDYKYFFEGKLHDATDTDDQGTPLDTTSPIQLPCQQSFVVFVTDGLASFDNDWDVVTDVIGDYDRDGNPEDCKKEGACDGEGSSGFFDDVAKYLFDQDLRADLGGKQNLVTHVIGFHQDAPLLKNAALLGGGKYFTAADRKELLSALKGAMGEVLDQSSSGTAAGTVSTSHSSEALLLKAEYMPGLWQGRLKAFRFPYAEGDSALWEAGEQLAGRASPRHIFTLLRGAKTEFLSDNPDLRSDLGALWSVSGEEAGEVIDFIRGVRTHEGGRFRDRGGWPLGDIIHSTPLAVGAPRFPYSEKDYAGFKNTYQDRPTLVYAGANDGMLHAFFAFDDPSGVGAWKAGEEAWAYVPRHLQAGLVGLTRNCHRYYVDLPPQAVDAWDSAWGSEAGGWKTVLLGGDNLGGEGYFLLEVTDPAWNRVEVLWDLIPFPDAVRKSSTRPLIGKLLPGEPNRWFAVVTSGFHEGSGAGKIVALNLASGTRAALWDAGGTLADELTTRSKDPSRPYYSLTSPAGVDENLDGFIDLIFAGDTEGTLWKFYYDFEERIWKKAARFHTGGQPITGRPTLVLDKGGNWRVYFGTGQYLINADKGNRERNAFYCLVEEPVTTRGPNKGHFVRTSSLAPADLQDLTGVATGAQLAALTPEQKMKMNEAGWFLSLDDPGGLPAERVIGQPLVAAGVVLFNTFTPDPDPCAHGGSARLYALDYLSSLQARVGAETVLRDEAGNDLGEGIRHGADIQGLPSDPVLHHDRETGKYSLIIQSSNTKTYSKGISLGVRPIAVQSWRVVDAHGN